MQREPRFSEFALTELKPFAEQFPIQYLKGNRGCNLAYRHFVHSQKTAKLVVLVNGRAENLLKWTEVAYDFYHQGYDVLVFDHRGQGYSQRLLKDRQKGYIDEFRFYADDMAKIIEKVTALSTYNEQFLVAHSLGGLISAFYLAHYDHQINATVLSAPLFEMPLKQPLRDEFLINLMILFGQGERYVFGKTAYKPADLDNNELSFCRTRMKWMNRINRKYAELHLGGPTFRWAHLCLNATKQLPKILPKIEIPVLILQAEKEKIVSNNTLEKLTALLPQGKLDIVSNAKHEILFERDSLRHQVFDQIFQFFNSK